MKSVSRGFDSRSGHLIFPCICSVIIPSDNTSISLFDDEQVVRNMSYAYYIK